MYRYSNGQISLADFKQPVGMNLKESNRWVKKAQTIPWLEIEKRYAALFTNRKGNVAKPLRLALGACIIQAEYGYSDEETALQIQENPYLQYFCGYPGYDDEKLPFDPSLMDQRAAMYRYSNGQISLADFKQPVGMNLKESNRWVKKAQTIPWLEIEKRYAALFTNRKGNVAKPLRLAARPAFARGGPPDPRHLHPSTLSTENIYRLKSCLQSGTNCYTIILRDTEAYRQGVEESDLPHAPMQEKAPPTQQKITAPKPILMYPE